MYFPAVGAPAGVQTLVDTSAAGFQRTPTYVAHVVGPRQLPGNGPYVDGLPAVVQPTPTGFVLRLALPRNLVVGTRPLNPNGAFTAATLQALQTALRWSVWWMGVEGQG